MHEEKFIDPFIEFVEKNFDNSQHKYIIRQSEKFNSKLRKNATFIEREMGKFGEFLLYAKHLNRADKIFLHGLFHNAILIILFLQPWLLKKCYWVIWGGDLYFYQNKKNGIKSILLEKLRSFVIIRIGHFITHIKGDYELTQKWYSAKGQWHECFMYPSNLYKEASTQSLPHEGINILLGNSADPSNNHIEVLDNLKRHASENIRIYCPLSYGDQSYAQRVSDYGGSLFGDKFIPLRDFMPLDKYNEFLSKIDIAIFNHNRQQGMGNATSLLGMGKKVFMREGVTPYMMFKSIGVKVYPIHNLDLNLIDANVALANCVAVKNYFSIDRLKEQWGMIYE